MLDIMGETDFRKLGITRALSEAGFGETQCEALVRAFGDAEAGNGDTASDGLRSEMAEFKAEMAEFKAEMAEFKADTTRQFDEVRAEIEGLRSEVNELRSDFKELRSEVNELRSDFKELRSETRQLVRDTADYQVVTERGLGELRTEMHRLLRRQTQMFVGFIIGLIGIVVAVMGLH